MSHTLRRVPLAIALDRQCFRACTVSLDVAGPPTLASQSPRQWHPAAESLSDNSRSDNVLTGILLLSLRAQDVCLEKEVAGVCFIDLHRHAC